MERDELKGKQTDVGEADMILSPVESGDGILMRVGLYHIGEVWNVNNNIENHANAALYAEAHNVANRTGMWAADMEARIKELEGALDDFLLWADIKDTGSIQAIRVRDCALALLNK